MTARPRFRTIGGVVTSGTGAPLPPAPVYPAVEADAACAAIEALIDALAALSAVQAEITATLLTSGFSGTFRGGFADAHAADLEAVESWWKGAASPLEADLATLQAGLERYAVDLAAHQDLVAARASIPAGVR